MRARSLKNTNHPIFQSAIVMNWRACGRRTLQRIQIGPISDVRTLTLKKSAASPCGLIMWQNRGREKEKRVVGRRESRQKGVQENVTMG